MLRDTDEKSEPSEHGPGIPLNHSALLLDVLDYKPWEFVGVFHKVNGSAHAVVRRLTDVRGYIAELPENADVYFGVCPTKGPARDGERGTADEVTRLPALWADLDVGPGKCSSRQVARAIIRDLSKVLGTRPSAITHTGNGYHPYWTILDGNADTAALAALNKRWGRLVKTTAERHEAAADSVFNLDRILRVPGTYNCKVVTNSRIAVQCFCDDGDPLTLAEIDVCLDTAGSPEVPDSTVSKGVPASPEAIAAFSDACTGNLFPGVLDERVNEILSSAGETRNPTHRQLWFAAIDARAQCFPWATAVKRLEQAARDSYAARGESEKFSAYDFARSVDNAVENAAGMTMEEAQLASDAYKIEAWAVTLTEVDEYKIFKVMEPSEWAAPVPEQKFLIIGSISQDTFGPNGGPKKSLKTHDNMALAIAVGTGQNLYCSEHFPVVQPGRVLYIVGEGGEKPTRRTLRRMCRAYGVNPEEMMSDPSKPIILVTGAAPLNNKQLRVELRQICDRYGPFVLVLMESFYNFHPVDVNAANLYERGQVIDDYHRFIQNTAGEDSTSFLTDHYRSTGTGKSLDLDNISMAGQAENADSWITRYHRQPPQVNDGDFWMRVGFSSRQWGGTVWDIDWHLGAFDHDLGHHVGDISWDVKPAEGGGDSDRTEIVRNILQVVKDNQWELTETGVLKEVGGKQEKKREVFEQLKVNGHVLIAKVKRKEGNRKVERDRIGIPGGEPIPDEGTS